MPEKGGNCCSLHRALVNPTDIKYPSLGQLLHQRYKVLQVLNSGAFGQVYLAQDTLDPTRSQCAIKYYFSDLNYPHLVKTSRRIFLNEAEYLKRLGVHPQIPQFLNCFEENRGFFLVQDYIAGTSLSQELAIARHSSPLERVAQVVYFLWDLLPVLHFIHQQNVMHGDIKPNNIMRRSHDGKVMLIDFGASQFLPKNPSPASKIATFPTYPTATSSPSGYLAAEQLRGQPTMGSDLYSVGIIALEWLTGLDVTHFQPHPKTYEIQWQAWTDHNPPPPYLEPLVAILRQLVRYHPENRYATAMEVLKDLEPLRSQVNHSLLHYWGEQRLNTLVPMPHHTAAAAQTPSAEADRDAGTATAAQFEDVALDDPELMPDEPWQVEHSGMMMARTAAIVADLPLLRSQSPSSTAQVLMRMGLVIGMLNVFAIALGYYTLTSSLSTDPGEEAWLAAQDAIQRGQLAEALTLAESIPRNSVRYEQSQAALQAWQTEWRTASSLINTAQTALDSHQWQMVLNIAAQMPEINYWKQKMHPLVEAARPRAEDEARRLLAQAYRSAQQRDFTRALSFLYQISPETQVGASIQPKLDEYQRKQSVRAMVQLQAAYDLAIAKQFRAAIAILEEIPTNTTAGAIAQEKLQEYHHKAQTRRALVASAS
jgi:serine/threonine-protein kinase